MKNTKELFIRLYTETLYSNFIVPLRGSNYIQSLYCDLRERLDFFFKQKRWLVWQEHANEVIQKLYRSWTSIKVDRLDQNLTETWLRLDDQFATKTLPENGTIEAKKVWQYASRKSADYEAIQKLDRSWTVFVAKNVTKMSLKCHQKIKILNWGIEAKNGIDLSMTFHQKKYHQMTTEIPPEIKVGEGKLRAKIKAKNINTTYHYLILPNSSFMLCC